MAGAIAELARRSVSRDFRSITPHCSRVILVEAGERAVAAFPGGAVRQGRADRWRQLGVEVRLQAPVTDIGDGLCPTATGADLRRRPSSGRPASRPRRPRNGSGAERDAHGRVFVEPDLRVPGRAISSRSATRPTRQARTGEPSPAVAPVAKQQGGYVADLILGRTTGRFSLPRLRQSRDDRPQPGSHRLGRRCSSAASSPGWSGPSPTSGSWSASAAARGQDRAGCGTTSLISAAPA